MAKAYLATLPPEIFEAVAERLTGRDLKALRLACREACSKVLRVYTRTLFTHHAFFLNSQESVELAVQISRHHVFGPAMKTITFLIEGAYARPDLREAMEVAQRSREAAFRRIKGASSSLSEDYAKYVELYECFHGQLAAQDKQNTFQASGSQITLLQQVFAAIVRTGTLQGVHLANRDTAETFPIIRAGMGGFSRSGKMHMPSCRDHSPFVLISNALQMACTEASTQFVLPTFTSHCGNWGLPARRLDQLNQFRNIQHLDLEVCAKGRTVEHCIPFGNSLLVAAIDSLKSLKLQVSRCKIGGTVHFTACLLSHEYSTLESLQLRGGRFHGSQLVEFAKRQPKLRRLDLQDVDVTIDRDDIRAMAVGGIDSFLAVEGTRKGITYL
ncbi:hypothetical protein CLAFUR0_14578 [Fulvia fulva]|nr:hypothetical protein CLAFUR0_14578 [Fulvia fulva]